MKSPSVHDFEHEARNMGGRSTLTELCVFVWAARKWWLFPLLVALLLLGALVWLSSTAAAPFIYTLF
jgi:hypothetical protein